MGASTSRGDAREARVREPDAWWDDERGERRRSRLAALLWGSRVGDPRRADEPFGPDTISGSRILVERLSRRGFWSARPVCPDAIATSNRGARERGLTEYEGNYGDYLELKRSACPRGARGIEPAELPATERVWLPRAEARTRSRRRAFSGPKRDPVRGRARVDRVQLQRSPRTPGNDPEYAT